MAERKISTRLVLEGEKEYKASITNINRELKTLESALKLTESSFKGQANTVQALEAKNKALNDVIAKTAEKLNAENTALDKAKAAKSGYAEAAQKAREQLDNLKKTTDDATKETEEYAKQVAVIQAEINKYEKAEAGAAAAVETHTQKANRAQTQINDLNGTLGENEKHLDEARKSTDGTAKSIDEFGKKTKEAGKEAEEFGEKSSEAVDALASALAAAGVVASIKAIADALKESVDASIEFESAMAGVAKTTDLTSEELAAMGAEIKDLTLNIPITASEFAQIVEVAGQLGVEKNNLIDFSTTMANLGVATNMTADEAATMIAQFAAITGMDASGYSRLGAAIVALGNNFATNEKKITDMSQAIAGAATNAGMSEPDMLALSAAVSSLGIEAQAGGTSMSSLISKIQAAVETGDGLNEWAAAAGLSASEFAALWGTDATAALGAFIGNLNNLDASANVTLGTLGITETRMVRMITSLANAESASGLLTNAINTSNSAWQENTALVTEASTRYKTTESQITLYKNSVQNLKIAVGDELTPALQVLAEAGKNINEWATEFVETNEGLVPVITAVVVALGTFVGGLTLLGVGIPAITKAMAALHTVMAANPWILAATAIAAVVAALAALTVQAVAADRALHESTQNVLDSIEAKNEAYRTSTGELTKQNASVEVMAARLNELASIENKTAAQKALMLSLVEQLNEAVPDLNLAYDDTNDTLNLTAEEIKKVTAAMMEQAKQAAAVQRLTGLYADEMELLYELGVAQDRVTQAQKDYNAAIDAHDRDAAIKAYKELTAAQQDVENLTDALVQNEGAQRGVTQAINEFGDAAANAGPAVQGLSEETQTAADEISHAMQTLIDCYDAAYSAAYENIEGTISGFGEMAATVPTHIQTINDALDSQISFIDTYMDNLAKAAEMGISEGLLAQLSDGSVESANILAGIVEDGGAKVQELNDKFQQVQEGKEAFAAQVAEMQTDFAEASGQIVSDAEQMVGDLNLKMEATTSGAETIQGYIDGLNSKLGQLAGIAAKINGYTAKGGKADGSHAFGLDYVPYDDYNATLHKGEAVLTALEAKAWRAEQVANYSYPDNRVTNVTQHNYFTVPTKAVYDEIADAVNRRLGGGNALRQFYLENAIGERRNLQTKKECFLRAPSGLGWADTNTYASAQGFFPRTFSEPTQPAPMGDLVFGGYEDYRDFVDWVHKGYDLTLVYSPDNAEYRIDIDLISVQKGEINMWGRLECPFVMAAKTPWYKPTTRELVIAPPASEGGYRRYSYKYTTRYAASSLSNQVEISASGHLPAALYMVCPGPLANPKLTLLGPTSAVIGVLDLTGIGIEADERLIYSTKFGQIGVWKDGTDLLPELDLNNNNFFDVPINQTCTLRLESDTDIETVATIQLFEYYRSV